MKPTPFWNATFTLINYDRTNQLQVDSSKMVSNRSFSNNLIWHCALCKSQYQPKFIDEIILKRGVFDWVSIKKDLPIKNWMFCFGSFDFCLIAMFNKQSHSWVFFFLIFSWYILLFLTSSDCESLHFKWLDFSLLSFFFISSPAHILHLMCMKLRAKGKDFTSIFLFIKFKL